MRSIIFISVIIAFSIRLYAENNNETVSSDAQQIRRQANVMSQQLGVCSSFLDAETIGDWNRCYQLLDSSVVSRFANASALEIYLKSHISGASFIKDVETPKAAQISTFGENGEVAFIKYWYKLSGRTHATAVFFILRKDPTTKVFKVWSAYPSRLTALFASNIIKRSTIPE